MMLHFLTFEEKDMNILMFYNYSNQDSPLFTSIKMIGCLWQWYGCRGKVTCIDNESLRCVSVFSVGLSHSKKLSDQIKFK